MLSSDRNGSAVDALPTSSSDGLPTFGHGEESQPETSSTTTPNLVPFDFTPGSMPGECLDLGLEDDMAMAMEMDRLFDLLPDTVNTSAAKSEEFRDLLATVLDEGTVVESNGSCEWSPGFQLSTTLPTSEINSTSLVTV